MDASVRIHLLRVEGLLLLVRLSDLSFCVRIRLLRQKTLYLAPCNTIASEMGLAPTDRRSLQDLDME